MKTTIQQLSKNFAAKAGLDVQVNSFDELENLLKDLVPIIKFDDNDDVNTTSLDAMIGGYFSECFTPEIRITGKKEVIAKLMTVVNSTVYDFDSGDDCYDNLAEIPDGSTVTWCLLDYDKMSDVFEQLRMFSETEQIDLPVTLNNVTPENIDKDIIRYAFCKGQRTGGGIISIVEDNTAWYPMRLYWLCYAFNGMTMEEVAAMDIQIKVQ